MMTGYRLFGWRQTGSMAVEAALAELGVVHEYVPVSRVTNENQTEAFTRINPRQQLPALQLPDGSIVTEGPAILAHLGDAFAERQLIPPPGSSARAQHDRWMAFLHANVYEGMLRGIRPQRYTDDPASAPAVKSAADAYVNRHFAILERSLTPAPFAFGADLQILDIYVWMLCYWMDQDWLRANCPRITGLFQAADARPHLRKVALRHFG